MGTRGGTGGPVGTVCGIDFGRLLGKDMLRLIQAAVGYERALLLQGSLTALQAFAVNLFRLWTGQRHCPFVGCSGQE